MKPVTKCIYFLARAGTAACMLLLSQQALAVGTDAGTTVDNQAQVDYQVAGVDQELILSDPNGNSVPGLASGANSTDFVVDNKVDLTLIETDSLPTPVNPGQANAVATFTLTNTGNLPQDYALSAVNLAPADPAVHGNTDNADVSNLRAIADNNDDGVYTAADTDLFVDNLANDDVRLVFIVADVPISVQNGDFANVRLTVVTHDANTGATSATTATAGADDPTVVDVVLADAGNDGTETADDGYAVSSAELTITKTSAVISDPFNGTTNPKAIPGAIVEYTITVQNTGTVDASNVVITDVLNANVALALAQYNGGTAGDDVEIALGTGPTLSYCSADASDTDTDGCGLVGSTLNVGPGITVGTVAATNPAVIRFRVTVQ